MISPDILAAVNESQNVGTAQVRRSLSLVGGSELVLGLSGTPSGALKPSLVPPVWCTGELKKNFPLQSD